MDPKDSLGSDTVGKFDGFRHPGCLPQVLRGCQEHRRSPGGIKEQVRTAFPQVLEAFHTGDPNMFPRKYCRDSKFSRLFTPHISTLWCVHATFCGI